MRDPAGRGRVGARLTWATVPRGPALGLLVLGMALSGCGSAGPTGGPATTTIPTRDPSTSGASPTATAPGSPAPSAPSAPKRQVTIAIGDDERVVDLFEPAAAAASKAPLLILLHASGESPFVMAQEARAGELAAREGVIVALPPALGHRWNVMVSAGDPIRKSADMVYVMGLIDRLAEDLPIDRGRVFVAGFSIGAVMSERVACQFADQVTAVALNAGAPWSDQCSPARPVPILVMHGTADNTFRIGLAGEVVARWRAADGCSGDPVMTQLSDIATAEVNEHCAGGATVEFVRYEGAGHRWFANPDATEVMWGFFAAQPSR